MAPRMQALSRKSSSSLATLSPAYFSMVMATGIISIGAHRLGFDGLALALFVVNIGIYLILWVLYGMRLWRYPRRFFADLTDHLEGAGFFTIVAATAIVGSQCLLVVDWLGVAVGLLLVAMVVRLALTYTIFTAFTVKTDKPRLDKGINGGWLLAVVATQAVASLSAMVAGHAGHHYALELNFITL